MQKRPLFAALSAILLFCALYFGLSNVSPERKGISKTRQVMGTVTDAESLIHAATDALNPGQKEQLRALMGSQDSLTVLQKETLSAWWVKANKPEVAGAYAEQIAQTTQTAAAWSIAGATLHMGINQAQASDIARKYCADQSKKAFENAISIEPDNPEHRINLALVYADAPSENPMQAVQILRELEAKYPDNVGVYNALGRLAIKTGQWDRALQRLEKALTLQPTNQNTVCLLAVAYEGAGNAAKAQDFARKCKAK
jgi:tetratricopeptide (TPR) repeat protein